MGFRRLALIFALPLALGACSSLKFWGKSTPEGMAELKPLVSPLNLEFAWHGSVGKNQDRLLQAAIVGDSVIAAGADGEITRFEDGKRVWRVDARKNLTAGIGAGDNLVVVAARNTVLAFDVKTGAALWKTDLVGEVSARPLVDGDQVYLRVGDSRIVSLASSDGRQRWSYQRTTPPLSLRTFNELRRMDAYLFGGFSGGRLVAISTNSGQLVWEGSVALPRGATELERMADVVGAPVAQGKLLCAASFQGRVTCFDVTRGAAVWGRDLSTSVGIDADSSQVFATDERGVVHALDIETGASLWKQEGLVLRGTGRPLVLEDHIVVGDAEGWIHVLDKKDGRIVGRIKTDGSAIQAPLERTGDGLIALTRDGGLFSLKLR
ncbi:outer membrane protein assembly factor BamB [Niveibacterium terrae]|uniref:outer membrane protein assembly factor BamB n=1 Tax=Niveibacterium terrae TaxID=3373598 RepID=UPI003A8DF368